MTWAGVVLWCVVNGARKYCVQLDRKRGGWELPKGGEELVRPRTSTGRTDSSLFATARAEFWEEAGVWLGWRDSGTFMWASPTGNHLTHGAQTGQGAYVCTQQAEHDEVQYHSQRSWMTIDEFSRRSTRDDHVRLLQRIESSLMFLHLIGTHST